MSTLCRKTVWMKTVMIKNQGNFQCLIEAPGIWPKILHFFLIENIAIYHRSHRFSSHSWMGSAWGIPMTSVIVQQEGMLLCIGHL